MAVYTHVSYKEITSFLFDYEIGKLISCNGITKGVENSNFLLRTCKKNYILTLYEKRVCTDDLPFFFGLMNHLVQYDINCPIPIERNDKSISGYLAGRPAAIFSFLDGQCINQPAEHHCYELGASLAKLHKAADNYNLFRQNSFSIDNWRDLFEKSRSRYHEVNEGLELLILKELDFLENNWPRDLPCGIIHADLFPDNVFFLNNNLSGLIDFYFSCNDILFYDVAICINAWCFDVNGIFNKKNALGLLTGYQSKHKITGNELAALPVLARGASLRFLLTRLHDWFNVSKKALVDIHDPHEYIMKLNFHQKINKFEDYGLYL